MCYIAPVLYCELFNMHCVSEADRWRGFSDKVRSRAPVHILSAEKLPTPSSSPCDGLGLLPSSLPLPSLLPLFLLVTSRTVEIMSGTTLRASTTTRRWWRHRCPSSATSHHCHFFALPNHSLFLPPPTGAPPPSGGGTIAAQPHRLQPATFA